MLILHLAGTRTGSGYDGQITSGRDLNWGYSRYVGWFTSGRDSNRVWICWSEYVRLGLELGLDMLASGRDSNARTSSRTASSLAFTCHWIIILLHASHIQYFIVRLQPSYSRSTCHHPTQILPPSSLKCTSIMQFTHLAVRNMLLLIFSSMRQYRASKIKSNCTLFKHLNK